MSAVALLIAISYVAMFGVVREADEGAMAHSWQWLMALQLPIVAIFALTQLRRVPQWTCRVLAIQAGMAVAAITPVWYFNL